jgi:flagellar biosynthesis anti-sigma factor FlgM
MRIDDNNNPANNGLGQTSRAAETQSTSSLSSSSSRDATVPGAPADSDGLQLSNFAGAISQLIQSDSTNRSQRVAQLAAAVQSGNYQVDAVAVSRAIVDYSISAG